MEALSDLSTFVKKSLPIKDITAISIRRERMLEGLKESIGEYLENCQKEQIVCLNRDLLLTRATCNGRAKTK